MRRLARPAVLVIVLIALVLPSAASRAQDRVAHLVTGDWPPYVGRELPGYGECARVVSLVLSEMRLHPRYEFLTWGRAAKLAAAAQNDDGVRGTFPYLKTAERDRLFYFSEPIFQVEQVIFYNKVLHPELGEVADLAELAKRRSVRVEDYAYPETFAMIMVDTVEEDDETAAFARLLDDPEVHFLPAARRVGEALLARDYPARRFDIAVIPHLSLTVDQYLMAPKLNPGSYGFVREFDRALARLSQSGVLDDLLHEARSDGGDLVELAVAAGETISATVADRPDQRILLTSGARAAVVVWGPAYTTAGADWNDAAARTCRVRVLTPPVRGLVVEVDGRYLRLLPGRSP